MKNSKANQMIQNIIQCIVWSILGACIALISSSALKIGVKIGCITGIVILMIALIFVFLKVFETEPSSYSGNKAAQKTPQKMPQHMNQVQKSNGNSSNGMITNARISRSGSTEPSNALDRKPMSVEKKEQQNKNTKNVTKLVLVNEEGDSLLEWSLAGKTALIIGKSTDKEKVDIDLECSAYAQMISKQHAVLNYTDGGWYVDDIDSKNGTRVKKLYQNSILDVKLVGTVEVEAGDIIYIANTMLQLK